MMRHSQTKGRANGKLELRPKPARLSSTLLTSGDGKRGVAAWPKPPRPSSTLQINGKKRHVLVDTQGLLLCAIVHAADIQDGGVMLMSALFGLYPFLRKRREKDLRSC